LCAGIRRANQRYGADAELGEIQDRAHAVAGENRVVDGVRGREQSVRGRNTPTLAHSGDNRQGRVKRIGRLLVPPLCVMNPGAGAGSIKSSGQTRNERPPRTNVDLPLHLRRGEIDARRGEPRERSFQSVAADLVGQIGKFAARVF
jgi:hypothetical protein